jgi:transcriptional regulator with XRE-family HTH domain
MRELRQAAGARQSDVADAVGISEAMVSLMETGARRIADEFACNLPAVIEKAVAARAERERESAARERQRRELLLAAARSLIARRGSMTEHEMQSALARRRWRGRPLARPSETKRLVADLVAAGELRKQAGPDGRVEVVRVDVTPRLLPGGLFGGEVQRRRQRARTKPAEMAKRVGRKRSTWLGWEKDGVPADQVDRVLAELARAEARSIKQRREAAGMTQTELGLAAGAAQTTVSTWEREDSPERPSEGQWPLIDSVLDAVAPNERELTAAELDRLMLEANISNAEMARALGLTAAPVSLMRRDKKPIPRKWWRRMREECERARNASVSVPDVREEALSFVVELLSGEGPMLATEIGRRLPPGFRGLAPAAIELGIKTRRLHRERRVLTSEGGRAREWDVVCPGPAPRGRPRRRHRDHELLPRALDLIDEHRGASSGKLARLLGCDSKVARRVIRLAIDRRRAHLALAPRVDGRRARLGVYPGAPGRTAALSAAELRRAQLSRGLTNPRLAELTGVSTTTIILWRRNGVPGPWVRCVRERLRTVPVVSERERQSRARDELLALLASSGPTSPWELGRTFPRELREQLGDAIQWAIRTDHAHKRPRQHRNRTRLALYLGPAPAAHGVAPSGQALAAERELAGFATQRAFAREIGVPPAYVCHWEKPGGIVPAARHGQVLDALQHGAPPAPRAPGPDDIRALRARRGWSLLEFARYVGVSVPTARRWERPNPPTMRPESRRRFRQLETGAVVRPLRDRDFAAELRKLLAEANVNQRQLARAVEVSDSAVSTWVRGEAEPPSELKDAIRRYLRAQAGQRDVDGAGESLPVSGAV